MLFNAKSVFIVACLLSGGCTLPTVPVEVGTAEPIKVDVKMRVDLYQHKDPNEKIVPAEDPTLAGAQSRSWKRLGEILTLKNAQIIGENRVGLLDIRSRPDGYGKYPDQVVAEENSDRSIRMQAEAERRKVPIEQVQTETATQNYHNAFSREWVEVDTDKDGIFTWVQKP
jgi:hypothetical protein